MVLQKCFKIFKTFTTLTKKKIEYVIKMRNESENIKTLVTLTKKKQMLIKSEMKVGTLLLALQKLKGF